jgi:hypothetical protein
MKFIYKHVAIFVTVFIIALLFDYFRFKQFHWTENCIQAFFFTVFLGLFRWLLNNSKMGKEKRRFEFNSVNEVP